MKPLTPRELQVLRLVCSGYASKEIALLLIITPKTVDAHRESIRKKLNVSNVAEMIAVALFHGLIIFEKEN